MGRLGQDAPQFINKQLILEAKKKKIQGIKKHILVSIFRETAQLWWIFLYLFIIPPVFNVKERHIVNT